MNAWANQDLLLGYKHPIFADGGIAIKGFNNVQESRTWIELNPTAFPSQ